MSPCQKRSVSSLGLCFLTEHESSPYWSSSSVYSVIQFSSVTQSYPTLRPHGLQHTRLPCSSPTPGPCSDSCPSSWWCHLTISSCHPLLLPQSFLASRSFPVSQFFTWGGQSIGVSTSASLLPMNIQDWFLLGWTGGISLHSKGLSRIFSNTKSTNSSVLSFPSSPTLTSIHDHWKNHSFD